MDPFIGSVPTTRCMVLSGADCDEMVTPDQESCPVGHHLKTRDLPTEPPSITGKAVHRPRLATAEEFESFSVDETALAQIADRPDNLIVSRAALSAFAEHHGVSDEQSRSELRLFVSQALKEQAWRRNEGGYWHLKLKGMEVTLSPAADVIVSYRTRHYERMPSEIFANVRSRFKSRSPQPPRGPLLPLEEVQQILRTDPHFSRRLIHVWARRREITEQAAEEELRDFLAADLQSAEWVPGKPATITVVSIRTWAVRMDTAEICAVWVTSLS